MLIDCWLKFFLKEEVIEIAGLKTDGGEYAPLPVLRTYRQGRERIVNQIRKLLVKICIPPEGGGG